MPFKGRCVAWACLAIVTGCSSPSRELEPKDLERAAHTLASVAAEGVLFSEQLESGTVGSSFGWVHQRALVEEAQQAGQKLFRPVAPPLRARQEQLTGLANRLEITLDRLSFAAGAGDAPQLLQLRQALHELQARSAALEEAR